MSICGDGSLVNSGARGGVAITLRCRAWTCEQCRPIRRAQVVREAVAGRPERFITLTARPTSNSTPLARARALARAWRVIVKRAVRAGFARRLSYFAVFEKTKLGEPHLHILQRGGYLPQKWLSQQMQELTGSPIVDIRRVGSGKIAARYVGKYLGKELSKFGSLKRYWCTRDWQIDKPDDGDDRPWGREPFYMSKKSIFTYAEAWVREGRDVWWDGEDTVGWGYEPPSDRLERGAGVAAARRIAGTARAWGYRAQ